MKWKQAAIFSDCHLQINHVSPCHPRSSVSFQPHTVSLRPHKGYIATPFDPMLPVSPIESKNSANGDVRSCQCPAKVCSSYQQNLQ
jgi:hypothetical protein